MTAILGHFIAKNLDKYVELMQANIAKDFIEIEDKKAFFKEILDEIKIKNALKAREL